MDLRLAAHTHSVAVARTLALVAAVLAALTGCSLFRATANGDPSTGPLPYPGGCAAFELSEIRCAAIVDSLREQTGLAAGDVARVELLPDSCGQDPFGQPVLCTRSGGSGVVRVRFTTTAGNVVEQTQYCGVGSQYSILCSDHPEIQVVLPTDGYRDIPCSGEAPDGCATPYPAPAPAEQVREQGISVAVLDVPLDHVGEYLIELGTGSLANGILEQSSLTVADIRPDSFLLQGPLRLEVESRAADGKPFDNYYLRGWSPGLEPIVARLRFAVLSFEPGAVLRLANITVN